jgi:hypothetical protein
VHIAYWLSSDTAVLKLRFTLLPGTEHQYGHFYFHFPVYVRKVLNYFVREATEPNSLQPGTTTAEIDCLCDCSRLDQRIPINNPPEMFEAFGNHENRGAEEAGKSGWK